MLNIPKQKVLERWDVLSEIIKDAVFSDENADIIWDVCKREHLSEDRIKIVARVVGDILFGFIYTDDLENEIVNDVKIDRQIAQIIATEITKKILSPIRSEIEQNYKPPVAITDIKRAEIPSQPIAEEIKSAPLAVEPAAAPAILPAQAGEIPAAKPEALFEEAPAIIHKEEKAHVITPPKVSLGGLMGIFKRTVEKTEAPQVAAEVQLGAGAPEGTPQAEQPPIAQTEKPKMRVVHYGDLRTPITPVEIFGKAEGVSPVIPVQPIPPATEIIQPQKPVAGSALGAAPEAPKIEILKPTAPKIEEIVPKEPVFKRVDFKESKAVPLGAKPPFVGLKSEEQAVKIPKPEPTKPIAPAGEEKREIGLKEIPVSEEVLDLRTMEKVKTENEK